MTTKTAITELRALPLAALCLLAAVAGPVLAADAKPAQPAQRVQMLDRIVAVVNNDVITGLELEDRIKLITMQLQKQGMQLPPPDVVQKQVLERMIVEQVQLQYAKETGIRVDDGQLDKTLQRIAQENKLTPEEFRTALERDGVNFAKFREEIRSEIMLARLREREVDNKVLVTDAEVDNALGNQAARKGAEDEFNIAHILIQVPEQASTEQVQARRARAEKALAELQKGGDFAKVAASYSDAPDALEGGTLGWRSAARMPSLFVEALQPLKPGEVSGVLRSPNGFHILKVVDKRSKDSPYIISRTHARHILIKTNEVMTGTEARQRLTQLKERVDHGADFAELARLHSEDGSANKGGDLGWVSPGDTVPEFEKAMNALKPGQVSEPVESPFGWHLIQVIERKTEDVSKERQRLQARMEIRGRKADEAYQDWLRQLRDRAYVEYRLEEK